MGEGLEGSVNSIIRSFGFAACGFSSPRSSAHSCSGHRSSPNQELDLLSAPLSCRLRAQSPWPCLADVSAELVQAALDEAFHEGQFDALSFADELSCKPLTALTCSIFDRKGLLEALGLDRQPFHTFLALIERNYDAGNENPYHNATHAAS